MEENQFGISGLTDEEVLLSRKKYGRNILQYKKENGFFDAIRSLIKEPMVILLLAVSSIYFVSGEIGDGLFLSAAVILVAVISLYQDSRSRNALDKLKNFTQPHCKVIRNDRLEKIANEELVVGDSLLLEEGGAVSADGTIVHSHDFSVNESILTGESFAVSKDAQQEDNQVFAGTTVVSGLAVVRIEAIGNLTQLGKIGKGLEQIQEEKTPMELQINNFVRKMVILGAIIFLIVWAINYMNSRLVLDSLLKALTLAMSILPEEIPVAFTTFMALGAWRLMKLGIVVKQLKTVETLGSATVICTDKTGTLTENRMSLAKIFSLASNQIIAPNAAMDSAQQELLNLAMWASEPQAFDPMEIALHEAYGEFIAEDERAHFHMLHEYPLGGKPPMMTHIFENDQGKRIISAKGAPEALMAVSALTNAQRRDIETALKSLTAEGYRVLAVGEATFSGSSFPKEQQALPFAFKGLVAFYDPPKHNIAAVLEKFYQAGLSVKIITGDIADTSLAIARQIGFKGIEKHVSGHDLLDLPEEQLGKKVMDTHIFTRMFPEAKLKIINALKAEGQVVVMTGDGVNDGPALKAAHIGIAMGKRGTEIAREAASLILVDDDLARMVDAIAMGRKIYANLKKAIQYIISIHIPIILTVFLPLVLGWIYPNIFSPTHIILLELIMGPTCSMIYENEPMEPNAMIRPPRPFNTTFFNSKELTTSIIQGLVITAGTLFTYQFAVAQGANEALTRAMVFTSLMSANIFLTLVNRSFYYSILTTLSYKNKLIGLILGLSVAILGIILYVKPIALFFEFEFLDLPNLLFCLVVGFVSVIWFEGVKGYKRMYTVNIRK